MMEKPESSEQKRQRLQEKYEYMRKWGKYETSYKWTEEDQRRENFWCWITMIILFAVAIGVPTLIYLFMTRVAGEGWVMALFTAIFAPIGAILVVAAIVRQ
jgi:uncharacterized membrane protein YhaH (DUF805 family)